MTEETKSVGAPGQGKAPAAKRRSPIRSELRGLSGAEVNDVVDFVRGIRQVDGARCTEIKSLLDAAGGTAFLREEDGGVFAVVLSAEEHDRLVAKSRGARPRR